MTAGIRACKGESIRKAENDDYSSEAIREMEKRPEPAKYIRMISASVINTLATITLAIGILCIIGYFVFADSKGISLTAGLYCLIVSIPLYIISNIAEDIHYQSYLQELITDENEWYHTQSLRKLQSIENILKQQDYAPQDQTQQDIRDEVPKPGGQPQKYVQYVETDMSKRRFKSAKEDAGDIRS